MPFGVRLFEGSWLVVAEDHPAVRADTAGWRKWCEENPEKCGGGGGKREKGDPLQSVGSFRRMTPAEVERADLAERVAKGVDPERVRSEQALRVKYGMTSDVWRSETTGAVVKFDDKAKATDAKKAEVLQGLEDVVTAQPHPRWGTEITVVVESTKGVAATMGAHGLTVRGGRTALLGPSVVKPAGQKSFDADVNEGRFMPAGKGVSIGRYTVAHEYGHMLDVPKGQERKPETARALRDILAGSGYGGQKQDRDPSEAFAESFAEWHLSGGKTMDNLARALAASEGWN